MYKSINQQFIEKINFLKKVKKITFKGIAEEIGIKEDRLKSIRRGQSKADERILNALDASYPFLLHLNTKDNENSTLSTRVKSLEKQVSVLQLNVRLLAATLQARTQSKVKMVSKDIEGKTEKEHEEALEQILKDTEKELNKIRGEKGLDD